MKIVDVCAFLSPQGGGVKTYIEQKLAIGPRLGHEIVIVAPGDHDAVVERGPGARIITLASPRFPLDRKYWYFADEERLHALLDSEAPDFVEASSPWRSASMVARWRPEVAKSLVMHADPLSAYAYRWFGGLLSRETIDRRFDRFWEHLRDLGEAFELVVCASRELQERLAAPAAPGGRGGPTAEWPTRRCTRWGSRPAYSPPNGAIRPCGVSCWNCATCPRMPTC